MQGKNLYEYAVIRVVPRVERSEFMNVGVILFSKRAKFIRFRYQINEEKLRCFSANLDICLISSTLESFEKIAHGSAEGGSIAKMDIPERFRWLTAERSSCIQTSRPHSGLADDLEQTFEKLWEEQIL